MTGAMGSVDADECDAPIGSADPGTDRPVSQERSSADAAIGSTKRRGLIASLAITMVLAILVGWLGFRFGQAYRDQQDHALFLQVGRQVAINLTTIDHTHVDADVQRILDGSTGAFRDDFHSRAQPFIDIVKQSQSSTQGSITEAGLESVSSDTAQVLVAVSVSMKLSNVVDAAQGPRAWRMRIEVQKIGDDAKVSNVQFVA
jgi:Mce-associated membrane protein